MNVTIQEIYALLGEQTMKIRVLENILTELEKEIEALKADGGKKEHDTDS